jgi:hypothetical protein
METGSRETGERIWNVHTRQRVAHVALMFPVLSHGSGYEECRAVFADLQHGLGFTLKLEAKITFEIPFDSQRTNGVTSHKTHLNRLVTAFPSPTASQQN